MWRLGRSLPERTVGRPEGGRRGVVRKREVALGLRPGQPFLLPPDGAPDLDVLAYFFSPSFGLLSEQSQLSYAKDLRLFLSFMEGQGRQWREASADDGLDYEFWRRRDERNPRRVSASKFAREWAACQRFYAWQERRGVLSSSGGGLAGVADLALRPHRESRSNRVKWLLADGLHPMARRRPRRAWARRRPGSRAGAAGTEVATRRSPTCCGAAGSACARPARCSRSSSPRSIRLATICAAGSGRAWRRCGEVETSGSAAPLDRAFRDTWFRAVGWRWTELVAPAGTTWRTAY
jgi:hypothetical protein